MIVRAIAACCCAMLLVAPRLTSQVLRLPIRPVDAPGGAAFATEVATLDLLAREDRIYAEVSRGNVPGWLRQLVPITMERRRDETPVTVTFWAAPDYLAIGSDTDYFLMPMSPHLAQRIADLTDSSLPTPAMVDAIWASATVRLGPDSIAPSAAMITVPVFAEHDAMVRARRRSDTLPLGSLVAGHKKDVVLTARLDTLPSRVAIYGWHKPDGRPIQPLNTWHTTGHVDYSHGIRLIGSAILVDGVRRRVSDVLRDSTLSSLLNDDGPMRKARYDSTWP